MSSATYPLYQGLELRAMFSSQNQALADPTSVVLLIEKPDSEQLTATYASGASTGDVTITKESTGVYTCTLTLDVQGYWLYRWRGIGGVITAGTGTFLVDYSPFTGEKL